LPVDRLSSGAGLVEPIAEIVVGLFETFAVTPAVAKGFACKEAEASR
jgi:hypothetical protein